MSVSADLRAVETGLYFAYGSNLDRDDWGAFCRSRGFDPGAIRPLCRARLPGETLVFDYRSARRGCGVLNIEVAQGEAVDGLLFKVSPHGWAALDAKEGHPHHYRRERVSVLDEGGHRMEAQTYRVVESLRQDFIAPSEHYLAVCRQGRAAFGLPTAQLDRSAEVPAHQS